MKGYIQHGVTLFMGSDSKSILIVPKGNGYLIFTLYSAGGITCYTKDKPISLKPYDGYQEIILPDELADALSIFDKDNATREFEELLRKFIKNHEETAKPQITTATVKIEKPNK